MEPQQENRLSESKTRGRNARKNRFIPVSIGAALAVVTVLGVSKWIIPNEKLVDVTQPMLDAALEKWEQNQPDDYRIQIQVEGNLNGVYNITVEDRKVVTAVFGDQELDNRRTLQTWSVPGMIRMLEIDMVTQERMKKDGLKLMVRANFDPKYGFPARYQRLDYSSRQTTSWKVVEFAVEEPSG